MMIVGLMQAIWRLDYCGIVVLIVTSFVPGVYYCFLCDGFMRNLYLSITFVLGRRPGPGDCPVLL